MKKAKIALFVAVTFMMLALVPNVHAYSLAGISGLNSGDMVHPESVDPTAGADSTIWEFDLGQTTNYFWIGLSFDQATTAQAADFSFTVANAHFSNVVRHVTDPLTLDTDDWVMLWTFDNGPSNIVTVDLGLNMVLSSSLAGGTTASGVELDGVSVPEPSTLLLLGSGITVLGFVRRKFKA